MIRDLHLSPLLSSRGGRFVQFYGPGTGFSVRRGWTCPALSGADFSGLSLLLLLLAPFVELGIDEEAVPEGVESGLKVWLRGSIFKPAFSEAIGGNTDPSYRARVAPSVDRES